MNLPPDNIPQVLRGLPQWVGWRYGRPRLDGKRPKIPVDPRTGLEAKANDPGTWGTLAEAQEAVMRHRLAGIGFFFVKGGGLTGIDFDDCIINGKTTPETEAMVQELDSYAEVSPSGQGIKVIVRGQKPTGIRCKVYGVPGCSRVEVYDQGRFFTVTGQRLTGTPAEVEDRQDALIAFCGRLGPKSAWNPTQAPATGQRAAAPARAAHSEGSDPVTAAVRCRWYLAKVRNSISGEDGHGAMYRAACETQRFGLNDGDAMAVLNWFNAEKCSPPWNSAEIAHKLEDAKHAVADAGEVGIRNARSDKQTDRHPNKPVGGKRWHNHLPTWILTIERPKLRPYQRVILQAIADRADAAPVDAHGSLGHAIIGYDELADITGMSQRTCIRHVKRLVAMGLLVVVARGGIEWATGEVRANEYRVPGSPELASGKVTV